MLTIDAFSQGWRTTVKYENQVELIQHNFCRVKEIELTSNNKEIKAIYYGILRFESVLKKMQDQAVLIRSDNIIIVQNIRKWKAKESLIERIKHVFYLEKRPQIQIITICIPGELNSTTDSLFRLRTSGDYTLKDGIIQIICKKSYYMPQIDIFATQYNKLTNNYVIVYLNDLGKHFHNIENSGDETENEGQGSKASTWQRRRFPTVHVANIRRDLLMRQNRIQYEHQHIQYDTQQLRSMQIQVLLKEISLPLHITPKIHVLSNNTISSNLQHELMIQLGNQQEIQAKSMLGQTQYLNKEVRYGEKGVIIYYPRVTCRKGNDLPSPYLLISPLATKNEYPFPRRTKNQERIRLKIEGQNMWNDAERGLERME
ncbi:MAG: hypothetical protein EZS28_026069 [Streblomastix strix]|uniref:Uncharacterized protein n=1 Tax=Streblomastix strix TaxID=222440 RepID=A0A5J4V7J4_9EUKA|nr:MAG: hypothetical protein EZS28_026069 [Streblomastix strix]